MSFLENKIKAFTEFRERELEYKREQLAADIKLKQEQMELDTKRRVSIQEQQMELQLQMMQALIQSKRKLAGNLLLHTYYMHSIQFLIA